MLNIFKRLFFRNSNYHVAFHMKDGQIFTCIDTIRTIPIAVKFQLLNLYKKRIKKEEKISLPIFEKGANYIIDFSKVNYFVIIGQNSDLWFDSSILGSEDGTTYITEKFGKVL